MANERSYHVNRKRDGSFKSFICALLVFLAFCLIIYCILAFVVNKKDKGPERESLQGSSKNKNDLAEAISGTTTQSTIKSKTKPRPVTTVHVTTTTTESATTTLRSQTTLPVLTTTQSTTKNRINPIPVTNQVITTTESATTTLGSQTTLSEATATQSTTRSKYNPIPVTNQVTTTESATTTLASQTTLSEATTTQSTTQSKNNLIPVTNQVTTTESATTTLGSQTTLPVATTTQSTTKSKNNPIPVTNQVITTTESATTTLGSQTTLPGVSTTTQSTTTSKNNPMPVTNQVTTTESATTTQGFQTTLPVSPTTQSTTSKNNPIPVTNPITTTESATTTPSSQTTLPVSTTTQSTTKSKNVPVTNQVATTTESATTTQGSQTTLPLSTTTQSTTKSKHIPVTNPVTTTESATTLVSQTTLPVSTTTQSITQSKTNPIPVTNPVTTTESATTTLGSQTTLPVSSSTQATLDECSIKCCKPVCYKKSISMIQKMNHKKGLACDNFYNFACGGDLTEENSHKNDFFQDLFTFIQTINLKSDKFLYDFKTFFDSCVKHEANFMYKERMSFILDGLKQQPTSIEDLLSETILTQTFPFFKVQIDIDPKTKKFIIKISPNKKGLKTELEDWSLQKILEKKCLQKQKLTKLERLNNLDDIYKLYSTCTRNLKRPLEKFVTELKQLNDTNLDKIYDDQTVNKIYEFLENIMNITDLKITDEEVYDINDLPKLLDVDWTKIINSIIGKKVHEVIVVNEQYFVQLKKEFDVLSKPLWTHLFLLLKYLNFYEATVLPNSNDRVDYCIKQSVQLMPDVANYRYGNIFYKKLDTHSIQYSIYKLKNELKEAFNKVTILESKTKSELNRIVDEIKISSLRDADKINISSLTDRYKNIQLFTNKYQTNLEKLLIFNRKYLFDLYEQDADLKTLSKYFHNVYEDYPKAFVKAKAIVIPLGMFYKYSTDLPNPLFISIFGFSVAREIARHFSRTEIKNYFKSFDPIQQTYDNLEAAEQYSKNTIEYSKKKFKFEVDPVSSVDKRIINNMAFRLAWNVIPNTTMQEMPFINKEYKKEQMFVIAMTQSFCQKETVFDAMLKLYEKNTLPAKMLIENIVLNFENFPSIFGCLPGARMNPPALKEQFPFTYHNYQQTTQTN